jgi:hypothetical protein
VALIKEKSQLRRIFNLYDIVQNRAVDGEESSTLLLQAAALAHQADDCDLRPLPITELVVPFLAKLRQERESVPMSCPALILTPSPAAGAKVNYRMSARPTGPWKNCIHGLSLRT